MGLAPIRFCLLQKSSVDLAIGWDKRVLFERKTAGSQAGIESIDTLFEAESLLKHERAKEIEPNPLHDRHHGHTSPERSLTAFNLSRKGAPHGNIPVLRRARHDGTTIHSAEQVGENRG